MENPIKKQKDEIQCPSCNSENIELEDIGEDNIYSLYCYNCMKLYDVSDIEKYVQQFEKVE